MEENNDIFLAEGDAQKIFHNLFGAIHLGSTYLRTDFSTPLNLESYVHI